MGDAEIEFGMRRCRFLERVYTGRYINMKVGTTRYALMLDEAGGA